VLHLPAGVDRSGRARLIARRTSLDERKSLQAALHGPSVCPGWTERMNTDPERRRRQLLDHHLGASG